MMDRTTKKKLFAVSQKNKKNEIESQKQKKRAGFPFIASFEFLCASRFVITGEKTFSIFPNKEYSKRKK